FRVFDAMNDARNLKTAIKAVINTDKHAQGAIAYTVSPVHTVDMWVDMGKRLEGMGCHSVCIKDMAGLLKPYVAEELVSRLKEECTVPISLHSHATTGLSTTSVIKAVEAGLDMADTAISSMSTTYGHSPTESVVSILEDTGRATGLDMELLEDIAAYFREVRKKYAAFEGALKGVDSRILASQVPGGMLTNMEHQLREQGATDKVDDVLLEIPKVRKDLGYLPLVTPTSQIVGTQAVLNVLTGERYKTITKETAAVLKGEYGATPAPVSSELQAKVLEGDEPITCRPADLLAPEMDKLTAELGEIANEKGIDLGNDSTEDVLIYALFPQVGLRFLENRGDAAAFEPAPSAGAAAETNATKANPAATAIAGAGVAEQYDVAVNGKTYAVTVSPAGTITQIAANPNSAPVASPSAPAEPVSAPLAGSIFKVPVTLGQSVVSGEVLVIMEAMKMETEVRAARDGTVAEILVKEGDAVQVGNTLLRLN
ncbi:MAG: oxaloacetate decarboxylase, partial [Gammaproteobacteria bacterium]